MSNCFEISMLKLHMSILCRSHLVRIWLSKLINLNMSDSSEDFNISDRSWLFKELILLFFVCCVRHIKWVNQSFRNFNVNFCCIFCWILSWIFCQILSCILDQCKYSCTVKFVVFKCSLFMMIFKIAESLAVHDYSIIFIIKIDLLDLELVKKHNADMK